MYLSMYLDDIAILTASVLGIIFPACLINAIRNPDKEAAESSKTKACILFGAIIFLTLLVINS